MLILLAGQLSCGAPQEENEAARSSADSLAPQAQAAESLPQPGRLPDTDTRITGLLQSSGLQPQEARALGIADAAYQLISQHAYFLQGTDSLQYFVGQCVTLTGQLQANWPQEADRQTAYGRRLFRVEQITPHPFSVCHYSDTSATQPQGREVTYTGTVARMQRPAPDIQYDYQLRLRQPYRDDNHPIAPGQLVRSLPLVAGDFEVLSRLEQSVRTEAEVQVRGIQHQGYAEQQAVWIVDLAGPTL
ncbi:hypothetical protein [Cesiribacter andamanensis]|uniref:hypothetical protein n=1 Tax=Cesiribacter andamanensis TaxID=649507 RepID=UPI000344B607|nr:hypothetical protein [Cesiribacter andamanensis]